MSTSSVSEPVASPERASVAGFPAHRRFPRGLTHAIFVCFATILIVLTVGTASAVSPPRLTTIVEKAPYAGVGYGFSTSENYLCEAGTKVLKFPDFNTTTGKAEAGGNATATSCYYPPGPKPLSFQELTLAAGFQSYNLTGLSGHVHFETHWKLSFEGNLRVHLGGTGQFAEALAEVDATGELLNVSSGSAQKYEDSVLIFEVNTTTGTDVPIKVTNAVATEFFNATLSSKFSYAVVAYVAIGLIGEVSLSGSSVAYSEIQMYGSAGSAKLTSYSD